MPDVETIYPLSPQQEGMLFESLSAPGAGVFIEQFAHELSGPLDGAAFGRAWQALVARHAALRTAFVWRNQQAPVQVVLRRVTATVEHYDWRGLPAGELERRFARVLADARRDFDLTGPPLTRLTLVRVREDSHRLVWTQHHLLMDGWCLPVLVGELETCYRAAVQGREAELPVVKPYSDYVTWLRRQDVAQAEAFWRRELGGVAPTALGRVTSDTAAASRGYGVERASLDAGLTARLDTLARAQRVTRSILVHALWAVLLGRYAETDDVLLGTTVAGRPPELEGVETMIGLFTATLPLRLRPNPERPFWPWLADVQTHHLDVRRYEHCSAGQIHAWSGLPASVALFDSVLVFENYPASKGSNDDSAGFVGARTAHPLTLLAFNSDRLELQAVYDERRLDGPGVRMRLDHLVRLAARAAADPDVSVAALQAAIADAEVPTVHSADRARGSAHTAHVEPETETERALADLWRDLLGVERVGAEDDFFALGGHSLVATQLVARLRQTYEVEVPLRVIFESRTLRELAEAVEDALLREVESAPHGGR